MPSTKTYVVCVDGKAAAWRAFELAMHEAKVHGARLVILHVIDWSDYHLISIPELAERHQAREKELAESHAITTPLVNLAQEAGIAAEARTVFGPAARTILEVAYDTSAQHLFLGRHNGTKVADILLGNITDDVIRTATSPVTVVP